jgi:hypothetical protein
LKHGSQTPDLKLSIIRCKIIAKDFLQNLLAKHCKLLLCFKVCNFLQSFLQNYCQIMQTLAKTFLQDYEHWSQRVGGHLLDFFPFWGAGICGKLGSINTAVTLPATQLPLQFWEFSNC